MLRACLPLISKSLYTLPSYTGNLATGIDMREILFVVNADS